ncbi:MAG: hypothetical protein AAGI66_04580 [Cyanobacteria bacterium P01_H01_bin.74]
MDTTSRNVVSNNVNSTKRETETMYREYYKAIGQYYCANNIDLDNLAERTRFKKQVLAYFFLTQFSDTEVDAKIEHNVDLQEEEQSDEMETDTDEEAFCNFCTIRKPEKEKALICLKCLAKINKEIVFILETRQKLLEVKQAERSKSLVNPNTVCTIESGYYKIGLETESTDEMMSASDTSALLKVSDKTIRHFGFERVKNT